ncbi:MAG: sensor histidine kinase [Chloroflexota bacterium]
MASMSLTSPRSIPMSTKTSADLRIDWAHVAHRGEAVVSVRDHGVGIPPDRQPFVFEPFYQAVPAGSPGYVGVVSLGLHLSKQIVEALGSQIWFASTQGQGSTFSFSLPLAD